MFFFLRSSVNRNYPQPYTGKRMVKYLWNKHTQLPTTTTINQYTYFCGFLCAIFQFFCFNFVFVFLNKFARKTIVAKQLLNLQM